MGLSLDSPPRLLYAMPNMSAKVYLVGIGPGQAGLITPQASEAIRQSDVIIGHRDTLALITDITAGKEILDNIQNPLERSRLAVEKARQNRVVTIVSSGDPGVYAIAATFFGYLQDNGITLDVEVIPGINLASYAASRLGAPEGNDTATISLTDQGTPWPNILKRLEAAAAADFVIAVYNPFGKLGPERLQQALKLLAGYRTTSTPVGVLSQAATPQERVEITTLGAVNALRMPRDTMIIIGNSQSYVYQGRMVTPRLYRPDTGY